MHVHRRAEAQAPGAHGRVEVRVRDDDGLDAAQLLHRLQLADSTVSRLWGSKGALPRDDHPQAQVKWSFQLAAAVWWCQAAWPCADS
jgi:hypothetical protein